MVDIQINLRGRLLMIGFSIKNAFRKRGIAILSSLGIGFGLMLMFVLGSFTAGVSAQFTENFSQALGIVQITEYNRQGAFSQLPINTTTILLENPDFGGDIEKFDVRVELASDFTTDYIGKMANTGDRITIFGINATLDTKMNGPTSKILEGRLFNSGANEAIVDSRLLNFAATNITLGGNVSAIVSFLPRVIQNLSIVGVYEQEESGAPAFVPRTYYIYTDLETAWALLTEAGLLSGYYTRIDLRFPSTSLNETNRYIDQINAFSEAGAFAPKRVTAFSSAQFISTIESTLSIFNTFIMIISIITALAGGMAIIVSQLMSVMERMKEFGILKATGWKNGHIFRNVVYESLTIGLLGALIGMGLGSGLIALFSSGVGPFGAASAIVTWDLVGQILLFGLSLGILGGLYPGLKAARVRPVVVLRGE
jgi:putative ABC transport system permease protein